MEIATSATSVMAVLCCFVLPIAGLFIWWTIAPTPDNILNFLFWKSIDIETEDEKKYRNALIQRGVTVPAQIISIRPLGHTRKLNGGSYKARVEYEVKVMPEGQPDFVSKFEYWLPLSWKNGTGEAVEEEYRRKIWVTYDPNDPSQIIYDHNDQDRAQILAVREVVKKRNHFIDMEREAIRVRDSGDESLAVVLELEELGVENEKERKEGKAVRIKFKVTPQSGAEFESETFAMLALESIQKMTPGKKMYIRFDRQKPEISALMRSAE